MSDGCNFTDWLCKIKCVRSSRAVFVQKALISYSCIVDKIASLLYNLFYKKKQDRQSSKKVVKEDEHSSCI